jgi:hypothetical protein
MSPKTKTPTDDAPASTYFEHAWKFPEPSGAKPGDPYPKLPKGNPWAVDPCGDEPLIDRTEDANTGVTTDDQS